MKKYSLKYVGSPTAIGGVYIMELLNEAEIVAKAKKDLNDELSSLQDVEAYCNEKDSEWELLIVQQTST